ncbi:MAG: hydroxyacid dehydrogenase, partial [Planctomycetota bacterium]|nr:hydroxyacid dehydrogenase [Planctomycetota bacterium]
MAYTVVIPQDITEPGKAFLRDKGYAVVVGSGSIGPEDIKKAIAPADAILARTAPFPREILAAAPSLKVIARHGIGVDNIDIDYCAVRGIRVSRTVGANSEAVADYAVALMLALARQIIPIDRRCRRGAWGTVMTADLSDRTLGLVGLGAIGRQMVRRARGFSMDIAAFDVAWDEAYARANGVRRLDVD